MNGRSLLLALALGAVPAAAAPKADPGYVLHEWGTFTTLSSSRGVLLSGIYQDDESLPRFVYDRRTAPAERYQALLKMETPVVYLYSDRPRTVSIGVDFPQGVMTQWYPDVLVNEPKPGSDAAGKRGRICWNPVRILAPKVPGDRLPKTKPSNPWNFARDVDANVLEVTAPDGKKQYERFLFYRGLGRSRIPVGVQMKGEDHIVVRNESVGPYVVRHGVLIHVRDGKIFARALPDIEATVDTPPIPLPDRETTVDDAMEIVQKALQKTGLYAKEARAMVRTWRTSYFETEGLRLLHVLPTKLVDQLLPLRARPAPRKTVRVLVARQDILTPAEERRDADAVRNAATMRDVHRALGRFSEPRLRNVIQYSQDAALRRRAQAFLAEMRETVR